jgi:hypothetical protein
VFKNIDGELHTTKLWRFFNSFKSEKKVPLVCHPEFKFLTEHIDKNYSADVVPHFILARFRRSSLQKSRL